MMENGYKASELYDFYTIWCSRNGERGVVSSKKFFVMMSMNKYLEINHQKDGKHSKLKETIKKTEIKE